MLSLRDQAIEVLNDWKSSGKIVQLNLQSGSHQIFGDGKVRELTSSAVWFGAGSVKVEIDISNGTLESARFSDGTISVHVVSHQSECFLTSVRTTVGNETPTRS